MKNTVITVIINYPTCTKIIVNLALLFALQLREGKNCLANTYDRERKY